MYTTMPLSSYKNPRYSYSWPIREEGPNSGCLLLQEDQEDIASSCFLSCQDLMIKTMPFPHNTSLTIYPGGDDYSYNLIFIPVINQPISSNRYYIIRKYHGEALRCAKLKDKQSCCFCFNVIPDPNPLPLDHEDVYQQFIISRSKTCEGYFSANCVASDGIVPTILRNNFEVKSASFSLPLSMEAKGLDSSIRNHLPDTKLLLTAVTVGKWYCPFMFIKDMSTKDQVKNSLFYTMTLERRWEKIFACKNQHGIAKRSVDMDVVISTQGIRVGGKEADQFEENLVDGFVCFKGKSVKGDELPCVGLSSVIVERMMWEQERVGWVGEDEKKMRIMRKVEFKGEGLWLSFDCFVLVERFTLRRLDGSLVLEYDFKHTNQVKIKWG